VREQPSQDACRYLDCQCRYGVPGSRGGRRGADPALKLSRRLKVHAARHHWAVMRLRAGVPLEVVRRQLGHSTPILTLQTYGAFVPSGEDRAHWEREVTKAEERRKAR
jgi:integrase